MTVYFGVKKTEKFFLDEEKKQWIEYKKLNEGELINYQDTISGKVVMDQDTRKGEIETKIGSDRAVLLKLAVCGYNIQINDTEILTEFDKNKWENDLYPTMDGDKAAELYEAIRVFNGFTEAKKKIREQYLVDLKSAARDWAKGHQIINPPPNLSLFMACNEFKCLPEAGGWNDQDPEVCQDFMVILNVIAEEENKKTKKKK